MSRHRPVRECPKCKEVQRLSLHHVYPKRFYGGDGNNTFFYLCRQCHYDLELLIPQTEKMVDAFYPAIIEVFINMETEDA